MRYTAYEQPEQATQWQQCEETICHIILGILGTVFTIYLQKIEGIVLGSQWIVPSMSVGTAIVLAACWYRRQLIDSASLCLVIIRNIEFRVQRDVLPSLYPIWWDLASSDDVSRSEIFDAFETSLHAGQGRRVYGYLATT